MNSRRGFPVKNPKGNCGDEETILAYSYPHRSLVKLEDALLKDGEPRVSGDLFHYIMEHETLHNKHSDSGFIRNIRCLEANSLKNIKNLLEQKLDIKEAKDNIIKNEIACEIAHQEVKEFIEGIDIYHIEHYLRKANSILEEPDPLLQKKLDIFWSGNFLDNEVYKKLRQLEVLSGTYSFPFLAATLTLDIPFLFEPYYLKGCSSRPVEETDLTKRLDKTIELLEDFYLSSDKYDSDPIKEIKDSEEEIFERGLAKNELKLSKIYDQTFGISINFFNHRLCPTSDIDHRSLTYPSSPILDYPKSSFNKVVESYSGLTKFEKTVISKIKPYFKKMGISISKDNATFPLIPESLTVGGLSIPTPNGEFIFLNPYSHLIGEEPDLDISCLDYGKRKTYSQCWFENITGMELIEKMIKQSLENKDLEMDCPFKGCYIWPLELNCKEETKCSDCGINKYVPIRDWMKKTEEIYDEFSSKEVDSEKELVRYREKRGA